MTLSSNHTISFLNDNGKVSVPDREYFRAQTQREAYNAIIERFAEISADHVAVRSQIASRLGKDRAQITRLLSEPSNITLDTLSDLLLAMGSQVEISQSKIGSDPKGNYMHPNSAYSSNTRNIPAIAVEDFSSKPMGQIKTQSLNLRNSSQPSRNNTSKLEFS